MLRSLKFGMLVQQQPWTMMLRAGRYWTTSSLTFAIPPPHSQRFGRGIRDVDNSSGNERTAVIDPNCHGPPSSDVCHAQPGAEWQRTMSGCQFARIEPFAARCVCSFCVEAGKSMRPNLCLGCIFVRRERGMLFRDRYTPRE